MQANPTSVSVARSRIVAVCIVIAGYSGCASSNFVMLRDMPASPLAGSLQLFSRRGPQPTARTVQLLRRYDLGDVLDEDANQLTGKLQQLNDLEPAAEKVYALAELAYIQGLQLERKKNVTGALERYGEAVAASYMYLLDSQFDRERNPYDPQFRRACDLYNGALEQVLRSLKSRGELRPGHSYTVATERKQYNVTIVMCGNWHAEDFGELEFVSDYEIEGLTNLYHTFGLGVPLIAIRQPHVDEDIAEKYYPSQLAFPVTALLRVLPHQGTQHQGHNQGKNPPPQRCVLELHDPTVTSDILVGDRKVPLETDLSTHLAYFLDQPAYDSKRIATIGLLKPDAAQQIRGLYMVEPYDPNKIPVMMVHGLWSSPLTWMEMFNDLRGLPEIRKHYQFWFYLYPTGQPFWVSSAQLRADLETMRNDLDPTRKITALDQMVLVGHSMGGLVSKLQTLESGNEFWEIVTDQPFEQLKASDEVRDALAKTFFFQPNHSIRRVVMIGTPHRGSEFSNPTTQMLGRMLIDMPQLLVRSRDQILRDNSDFFQDERLLTIDTSIESLAPDSPVMPVMLTARAAPGVKYHNIVGVVSGHGVIGSVATKCGDGIVSFSSAHLDGVTSEETVDADHVHLHRHPRSILEVRRILIEHLNELKSTELVTVPHRQAVRPVSDTTIPPGIVQPSIPGLLQ